MPHPPIILFCLLPLLTGIALLALVRRPGLSRGIGTLSLLGQIGYAVALLGWIGPAGGILVSQAGDWIAPYGITLVFDSLSGLLITATLLVALASYLHGFASLPPDTEKRYYHPLFHLLLFGVNLSFLTGDLFNLFVAFEIMLMASYGLLILGTGKLQLSQAYKYLLLNVLASTLFLMAAGMAYGMLGTLNLADMARALRSGTAPAGLPALAMLFLLVFGMKGAVFPLWCWLPDTYPTLPIALGGLFAGVLTKVGVYAIARTFPLVFAATPESALLLQQVAGPIAAVSMFLAVLGAVSQHRIRHILSVHVISQVGYMLFALVIACGVATGTAPQIAAAALTGCVLFMIHNMVVKSALFLCCGVIERHTGTDDLNRLGGLLERHRLLALLFFLAAMSLVGLPPLSGFFGKLLILRAGWQDFGWLVLVALLTSCFTLLSMLKIWSYAFWSPTPPTSTPTSPEDRSDLGAARESAAGLVAGGSLRWAYLGITLLVLLALLLGPGVRPVLHLAAHAGRQMTDPHAHDYITAVLGEKAAPGNVVGSEATQDRFRSPVLPHLLTALPGEEPRP